MHLHQSWSLCFKCFIWFGQVLVWSFCHCHLAFCLSLKSRLHWKGIDSHQEKIVIIGTHTSRCNTRGRAIYIYNTLFFQMTNFFSVIFWVRSRFWVFSTLLKIWPKNNRSFKKSNVLYVEIHQSLGPHEYQFLANSEFFVG